MFALQSITPTASTPALGPPFAFWVVLCVLGLGVGAVGSAVTRRLSNPVAKYRLLYVGVVFPLGLLAYGLLSLLEFGAAVVGTLVGGSTGVVVLDAVLAEFLTMTAGGGVGLAAYAPTIRGVRAVRGIDLGTRRAVQVMGRYVVGLAAAFALVYAPFRLGIGGDGSTVALSLGFVAFAGSVLVASPWLIVALRETAPPSGEMADRLDRLRERAGLGPGVVGGVRLLDTDDEGTVGAVVRGLGPTRRLFVTTTFLDAFDEDTAVALLAVRAGRVRSRAFSRQIGALVATALPLVVGVTGAGPLGPLVVVSGVALLSGLWYTRRGVVAADDHAADRIGADTVADALDRYATVHELEPSRRRVPNPLSATVPLGDRIDRLRERGAGDVDALES